MIIIISGVHTYINNRLILTIKLPREKYNNKSE